MASWYEILLPFFMYKIELQRVTIKEFNRVQRCKVNRMPALSGLKAFSNIYCCHAEFIVSYNVDWKLFA